MAKSTRPPIGRSLHIGVNRLNPAEYPFKEYDGAKFKIFACDGDERTAIDADRYVIAWIGPLGDKELTGCEKDAKDMEQLAEKQGFRPRKLLTTQLATAENVKAEIEAAASELEDGDMFLVTYAGHGLHAKDRNKDEVDDQYDETWCLYDRMFIDDEQHALYSTFRPGVRILVLLDSCHSGSGTRSAPGSAPAAGNVVSRNAPPEVDAFIYEYEENTRRYDAIQAGLHRGKGNVNVVSISACQDTEEAMGDDEGGYFTGAVKRAWQSGKAQNYVQFFELVKSELADKHPDAQQEPRMDHKISETPLEEAIRDGKELIQAEFDAAVEASEEDEEALRRLAGFLAARPLTI